MMSLKYLFGAIFCAPFQTLNNILQNDAIQKLLIEVRVHYSDLEETLNLTQVKSFNQALASNTSLHRLELVLEHEWCYECALLVPDSRVSILYHEPQSSDSED